MTEILIADTSKSGLVMTSEVFKDKIPGTLITVCLSGQDCLEKASEKKFDMIVIDFDLPDTDGVTLTKLLRLKFSGPILITAFPEAVVEQAIVAELFAFKDSSMWIEKPIKFEKLAEKIEHFLIEKRRLHKRFVSKGQATLSVASSKKGKVEGKLLNLSFGGALLEFKERMAFKNGESVVLDLQSKKEKGAKQAAVRAQPLTGLSKIRAKVAWLDKQTLQAGLKFEKLSKTHEKCLEDVLRNSKEYE